MRKALLLPLISLLFSLTNAQTDTLKNSLLWQISGNGIETPSYIFGTVHIIPEKDYFFTETMQKSFDACKEFVAETNLDMSFSEKINLAKQLFIPEGKTVFDYMTKEDSVKFKNYILDTLKIKNSTYKRMQKIKPMLSSSLILEELITNPKIYEKELLKNAKKNKMKISGLETMQFQMNLINKISIEDQIEMMLENLSENPLKSYEELISVYKKQNINKLRELIDTDDSMAELGDDFIKNRNKDWIGKIEKIINKNPAFIAVGAGHLAGKDGILNLIKQKGYDITPLN